MQEGDAAFFPLPGNNQPIPCHAQEALPLQGSVTVNELLLSDTGLLGFWKIALHAISVAFWMFAVGEEKL